MEFFKALSLFPLVISAVASASSLVQRDLTAPIAQVRNGTLMGKYDATYDQDFFLGVPYSQPPVGDLRFRQAQSLNSTWNGTKSATQYVPDCIGYGSDEWANPKVVSEDCLILNVVRPAGVTADTKLPVGLWIHGGGYYEGGSSDPRYNLSFIVQQSTYARSPFIAVQINYRLQAWGFLFGQEIVDAGSTNMGIRDQRLALQWVQENIAAFGGDPEKVTIWGESAGAGSVGVHLTAYNGRNDGLFRGAIMESGSPSGTNLVAANWQKYYNNITQAAGCSNATDSLDCLRGLSVDTLSSVFNSSVTASARFAPQVDGDLIVGSGTDQMRNGKFVRVPIISGANHDEGTSFSKMGVNTNAQFMAYLASEGYDNVTSTILATLYPDIPAIGIPPTLEGRPSNSSGLGAQWKRSSAFAGDYSMHGNRRLTSQSWAKYGVPNYSYHFNVLPAGIPYTNGVAHFTEVSSVFHNINGLGYNNSVAFDPFEGVPASHVQVATMMSRMWISFIVDLDPNNSGVGCVNWPAYAVESPRNIVFDANKTELAYAEPDFYRAEAINYLMTLL